MSVKNFFEKIFNEIVSWLVFLIARFCFFTSRKTYVNKDLFDSVAENGVPVIYMCWHGRLFIVPHIRPKQKQVDCIVSNNRDGEIIAGVLHKCGFGTIRGSSNKTKKEGVLFTKDKGGTKALRESLRSLKKGRGLGITPDGPRGPARKIKANSLMMAGMSGVKILTFTFSSKPCFRLKSWDRFMFPMPFSSIYIKFGKFHEVDKTASEKDLEKLATKIEKNLNEITEDVDKLAGLD